MWVTMKERSLKTVEDGLVNVLRVDQRDEAQRKVKLGGGSMNKRF